MSVYCISSYVLRCYTPE